MIRKFENSSLVDETRIVRDGLLAVQERDGSNNVLREYTWGLNLGGGIGGLLNLKQGGQDYAYLYDGKGNVAAVIDSSQAVVAAYRYAPFGKLLAKTGSLEQSFGFSTKRYDAQTGLIEYGFRRYAPAIGRWTTRDPLGEAGGMNLYAFVGNNPVNWVDPWGLKIDNSKCNKPVYYKHEDSIEPLVVKPKTKYKGRQDGAIEPSTGDVYKTAGKGWLPFSLDDIWLDENCTIHDVNKTIGGGKKDEEFRKAHEDWEPLFKKADEIKEQIEQEKEKAQKVYK
jgi:RHS repeat-associated protein